MKKVSVEEWIKMYDSHIFKIRFNRDRVFNEIRFDCIECGYGFYIYDKIFYEEVPWDIRKYMKNNFNKPAFSDLMYQDMSEIYCSVFRFKNLLK